MTTAAHFDEYCAARRAFDESLPAISDGELEPLTMRLLDAEQAILDAPVRDLADVERKLQVIADWGALESVPPRAIRQVLAQVRVAAEHETTGRACPARSVAPEATPHG